MRVLFIGDIVGPDAIAAVADWVPAVRRERSVDLVIANAENAIVSGPDPTTGFGMSLDAIARLFEAGVDVITSGNHAWDGVEAERVLEHPRVLRPCNVPPSWAGKGVVTLLVGAEAVTVVNLADDGAIPAAAAPYPAWRGCATIGTVIVDFHGERFEEKIGFAYAVDGEVAAVLGTHTHEATLPLHHLPEGTAFVADVGMVGPTGGWGGMDTQRLVARLKGEAAEALPPLSLATGPLSIGAVLLDIEAGLTTTLVRLP